MLVRIVLFLAIWATVVAVAAMELYPALANGAGRWRWPLLVVAPLIYVTAELVAAKVFSHESGVRISSAFSWKRVLIALLVCLGVAWMIAVAVLM